MLYYTRLETPICEIILVGNEDGLTNLHLNTGKGSRTFEIDANWQQNDEFFTAIKQQILEYFEGKLTRFNLKLNPQGTDYQKKVWNALRDIPFGTVHSYKDVATAIGNPKASRAVGMANSKNPIPLIVPCHRVIGSNGELTGFAHGLEAKQALLQHEGAA